MTDPGTCSHPGAHVHGLIGAGEPAALPEETILDLAPAEWGRLDETLREGERVSAAIGACGDCGSLVVAVTTWNPADGRGQNVRTYQTPWVAMYAVSGEYGRPVPADPQARLERRAIRGAVRSGS